MTAAISWKDLRGGNGRGGSPHRSTSNDRAPWAVNGRLQVVDGAEVEFFPIGSLAQALGRSPRTVRRWEEQGVLPRCRYWSRYSSVNGRRRWYSRSTIEVVLHIAEQEGLIGRKVANFDQNHFADRTRSALRDLGGASAGP